MDCSVALQPWLLYKPSEPFAVADLREFIRPRVSAKEIESLTFDTPSFLGTIRGYKSRYYYYYRIHVATLLPSGTYPAATRTSLCDRVESPPPPLLSPRCDG